MIPNRRIYNHSFLGGLGKFKFFDENGNLMGIKTPEYLEPGPIFIHHVTSINEFRPRRSIRSRCTTIMVNNDYYETVAVGTL